MFIKVINTSNNELPKYNHFGDSGMDVRAFVYGNDVVRIFPKTIELISTGLFVEIPFGFEIQLRQRSGLSKLKIKLANAIGTIDSNYRGEIKLMIENTGDELYQIKNGDRVGQLVLCPVYQIDWLEVDELISTSRGEGGFGHTGIE